MTKQQRAITSQWRLISMTTQEYLETILKQQSLSDDSDEIKALRSERDIVEKVLRDSLEKSKPNIQYAGSYKKGTMIKDNYDLDIVCFFNHDDTEAGETLQEIYNNVKEVLGSNYHVVPKRSALQLQNKDPLKFGIYFHIDVVPGRFTDDKREDAFLYQSSGEKKYLKTNLQKHIKHIKNSGLRDIIKLIKSWKVRNGLDIKTFVLELLVVKILKKTKNKDYAKILINFWQELKDNIDEIHIEDPANPQGNDLSSFFNETVKNRLTALSANALILVEQNRWREIFGEIEKMTNMEKIVAVQTIIKQNPKPVKPWSETG